MDVHFDIENPLKVYFSIFLCEGRVYFIYSQKFQESFYINILEFNSEQRIFCDNILRTVYADWQTYTLTCRVPSRLCYINSASPTIILSKFSFLRLLPPYRSELSHNFREFATLNEYDFLSSKKEWLADFTYYSIKSQIS